MAEFAHVLVTGGAGFIGSHYVDYLLSEVSQVSRVIVLDSLTYAADSGFFTSLAEKFPEKVICIKGAIADSPLVEEIITTYSVDTVVNFAAETHVDRSIVNPADFINTNILGTFQLLEAVKHCWKGRKDVLFHQISTDEVFGVPTEEVEKGLVPVSVCYAPRNIYAASKASADHMVNAYFCTYGIPVTISYGCNTYGPRQAKEKLIPKVIDSLQKGESIPIYGNGMQKREWLYVTDHVRGIAAIDKRRAVGSSYSLGSGVICSNIELVTKICKEYADISGVSQAACLEAVQFVPDRPGHDRLYMMESKDSWKSLEIEPETALLSGLRKTILWYLEH